jgi:hypothetical protein
LTDTTIIKKAAGETCGFLSIGILTNCTFRATSHGTKVGIKEDKKKPE